MAPAARRRDRRRAAVGRYMRHRSGSERRTMSPDSPPPPVADPSVCCQPHQACELRSSTTPVRPAGRGPTPLLSPMSGGGGGSGGAAEVHAPLGARPSASTGRPPSRTRTNGTALTRMLRPVPGSSISRDSDFRHPHVHPASTKLPRPAGLRSVIALGPEMWTGPILPVYAAQLVVNIPRRAGTVTLACGMQRTQSESRPLLRRTSFLPPQVYTATSCSTADAAPG